MAKKWIQKAIKRPGRMRKWCKKRGYPGATCNCLRSALNQAKKSGDKSLAGAARLGLRLKKCGKHKLKGGGVVSRDLSSILMDMLS